MANVEVYADVVCPFAYVGLTHLIRRRHQLGRDDVHFRIRGWPLELVNGEPVDAHSIGEEIDEIKPQVAPDLFAGFDTEQFPSSTLPALALTAAAYEIGEATGEAVAMRLRRLVFEHGRDVADPAVLTDVAQRNNVPTLGDVAVVRDEWTAGRSRGVVGSPHFFVDGESLFCPVLDIRRVDGALVVKIDERAYEAFVTRCFG
ncbi:MAG TPA: DsbA family protein [Ilumatobacteraceae bacterium]|nr:DsbA family protein [Ilumatobacteraceae bacterium]